MPPTANERSPGLPDSSRNKICTAAPPEARIRLRASFRHGLPTSPKMRRYHNEPLLSPSDLNDLLECRHLMALKLAAFEGKAGPEAQPRRPHRDPGALRRAARAGHPRALRSARAARSSGSRPAAARRSCSRAVAQTLDAMRRGVEVIHQAALVGGGIGGYADFLERVDRPSELGEWSYERRRRQAGAHRPRPTSWCSCRHTPALLDRLQGHPPEQLAVLLGDGRRDSTAPPTSPPTCGRFCGHAKQTITQGLADTYPLPCSHCGICGYRRACEQRRIDDDHLSLVAGLRRDQLARLEAAGVPTLTALAELPDDTKVPRVPTRHAAPSCGARQRCSCTSAPTGEQVYELLPYQDGYGFGQLPRAGVGRPVLRHRGRPLHRRQGPRVPVRGGLAGRRRQRARSSRSGRTTASRSGARSRHWSTSSARGARRHPGSHIYHYARIRGAGAEDARDVARHPRGGDRSTCCAPAPWSTCSGWCARACASPRTATR